MKKNDKLIVILGVIILILSSIGIYYWVPEGLESKTVSIKELENIAGVLAAGPDAIIASDSNPFYPLIATPLAINYDADGEQTVVPLLVENLDDPSDAVLRIKNQLIIYGEELIDESKSAKEISLYIAEKYWKKSDVVLLVKYL